GAQCARWRDNSRAQPPTAATPADRRDRAGRRHTAPRPAPAARHTKTSLFGMPASSPLCLGSVHQPRHIFAAVAAQTLARARPVGFVAVLAELVFAFQFFDTQ